VSRIQRFITDSLAELRKVNWPTPQQARNLTVLVLAVSAAISLYISLFDYVFGFVAKTFNAG
jgi:preprotein translocase subunit SecE